MIQKIQTCDVIFLQIRILLNLRHRISNWIIRLKFINWNAFEFWLLQVDVVNRFYVILLELVQESVDVGALFNGETLWWLEVGGVTKGTMVEILVVFVAIGDSVAVKVVVFSYFNAVWRGSWHVVDVSVA